MTLALLLTNILWMVFWIITSADKEKSKIAIKRIDPFVKSLKKAKVEVDEIEEQLKNMQEVTEAPLEEVRKSVKLS